MRGEIVSLTAMRGIAALGVVLFHYRALISLDIDQRLHSDLLASGYLWVDFFFILSGFVMAYVYADSIAMRRISPIEFANARFFRLYPVHIFTLILMIIPELLGWVLVNYGVIHATSMSGNRTTIGLISSTSGVTAVFLRCYFDLVLFIFSG